MLKRIAMAAVVIGVPFSGLARAGDFFGLDAVGTSGTNISVNASNLINLTNDLINQQGKFASLAGQGVSATLTYGGVPNAVAVTENAAQTSATLSFPSTGFTQTFTATSASSLQTQIENFLKQNGAGAYAAFLKSINQESAIALVDGNPQSFTAFVATDAFERFGLLGADANAGPRGTSGDGQFRIDAEGGISRSSGLDGDYGSVAIGSDFRFNDNVALAFGTAFQYRDEAGASSYFVAQEVGLPVTIIKQQSSGLSWQVTPWGFGAIGASEDQVNGAVLVGGGGTSSLSLALGDFTFTLADQISYSSGIPVSYGNYTFDTDVNQWILKNGGKVTYNPGQSPFFVDVGISYSNLLHHGAVPDYWTPEAGLGLYFGHGNTSGIRVAYSGDFAKGYNDFGGTVSLFFAF